MPPYNEEFDRASEERLLEQKSPLSARNASASKRLHDICEPRLYSVSEAAMEDKNKRSQM